MKLPDFLKNLSFRRIMKRSDKAPRPKREVVSWWTAILTAGVLMLAIGHSADTKLLMPGPISTAHSSLGQCSDCHSNVKDGQLGWLHSIVAVADPNKDSSTCLTCHKMGKAALQPHGLEVAKLDAYVREIRSKPTAQAMPLQSRIREAVFSTKDTFADGVFCATCHKEHQGGDVKLKDMADAQCHTCHSVQFDNFKTSHPEFNGYPFRRRTRINFDHSSHFKKHFPEWDAKKVNAGQTPGICADCHTASPQNGHMNVKPFATICSACHIDQIVGAERATGPKGIALLTVPGIDVATLREKNIQIGVWPDESEGELGPLMKLLIGRNAEGRKTLAATDKLDLLDLTDASPEQIEQVGKLAWEVKQLFYDLAISGTADVMKRLDPAAKPGADQVPLESLTASMPRDVLASALREWLPRLASEIEARSDGEQTNSLIIVPAAVKSDSPATIPVENSGSEQDAEAPPQQSEVRIAQAQDATPEKPVAREKPAGPVVLGNSDQWRVDAFGRLIKGNAPPEDEDEDEDEDEEDTADVEATDDDATAEADDTEDQVEADADELTTDTDTETASETEAETDVAEESETDAAESDVDTESWAAFGGWYRQDYSILYKPTGHADPFMKGWLDFSAGRFKQSEGNLVAAVFSELTGKDAQGQCIKCHSVDAMKNKSRTMKWEPASHSTRQSLFTSFSHEPHLGVVKEKGCLTCHDMSGAKGYQDTYKGHDPAKFVSNFKPVKRETCASCHGKEQARQDCLLCHKYHVDGVATPIMQTKIPLK